MIFLSAQPYDDYFVWQVEVQIVNFRKFNISKDMHILVWHPKTARLDKWYSLQLKYPEVHIFFYEDEGVDLALYIPQLRPHSLKKHFKVFPELGKQPIFYHDSDIIFNYLPDFELLCKDEVVWQSDCSGYLDYDYLRSKEIQGNIPENEAILELAKIGGVSLETIQSYNKNTGGAQCLLKGIDSEFWEDIETQVLAIRRKFFFGVPDSINKLYFQSEGAGFQSWCADMWALNMALWKRNIVTNTTKVLDFSWATDTSETYKQKPIMHNAGATKQTPGLFYKGDWINKSPVGKRHAVKKDSASYFYVKAIIDVK